MTNNFKEGMAHANKDLSFIDWDGLDHEEYNKLNKIISATKSSGVQLLYVDEEGQTDIVPDNTKIPDAKDKEEPSIEPEFVEVVEKVPEFEIKKAVVDIKNSILHPAAPVFQPSVPPPSIMPFPMAVPHWTHGDPNMHPPQPQASPYPYHHHHHHPGGYVFHPDHNMMGHNGEPAVTYVTLSNGHQAYFSHPIPAHHFQHTNMPSGLPPLPNSAARGHHMHHQGDVIVHPVTGAVIPTTPSHHPLVYPPHIATTTLGQPLPAHMIPSHTMSQQHHPLHNQHSTQFMYIPQQQIPTESSSHAHHNGKAFDYNNDNIAPVSVHSTPTPKEKRENRTALENSEESNVTIEKSPKQASVGGIEFGGPVVFDVESLVENVSSPSSGIASLNSPTTDRVNSPPSPTQGVLITIKEKSKTVLDLTSQKKDKEHEKVPESTALSIPPVETLAITSQNHQSSNKHPAKSSSVNKSPSSNVKKESVDSSPLLNVNVNANPCSSNVNTSPSSSPKVSSSKTKGSDTPTQPPKPSPKVNDKKKEATSVKADGGKKDLPKPQLTPKEIDGSKTGKDTTKSQSAAPVPQPKAPVPQPKAPVPQPTAPVAAIAPKSWSSLFGKPALDATPTTQEPTVINSVKPPPFNSSDKPPVKKVQWQEQEMQRGREKETFPAPNKVKSVDVRQDPLAPKLLAKLSDFPISHIPIIVQPRGLKNGNNICFMNATLQVLMGCPPFIHLFRAFRNLPRSGNNSSTPVFDALVEFVNSFQNCQRRLKQGASKSKKGNEYDINVGVPFIPESLLNVAQQILGLKIGVQHDAEEFLSQILSICNEEVEKIIQMKNLDSINNNNASNKRVDNSHSSHHQNGHVEVENQNGGGEEDGDDSWVQVGHKNHCVETNVNNCGQTPLSAIFAGLSRSCLIRESGKSSDTVDSFFTLKLDIQTDSVHSVPEALIRLNAMEDVHDVDGRKVNGRRRMFFDVLPSVLIMHLKLFEYCNGNGQKIQKNISFDVDLQIPREMLSRVGKSKYPNAKARSYKLFGVVNHHGTKMNDGHYTSDAFLPIVNGWLHFDDSNVSISDEASVLRYHDKSMPYLLFYRRIDV